MSTKVQELLAKKAALQATLAKDTPKEFPDAHPEETQDTGRENATLTQGVTQAKDTTSPPSHNLHNSTSSANPMAGFRAKLSSGKKAAGASKLAKVKVQQLKAEQAAENVTAQVEDSEAELLRKFTATEEMHLIDDFSPDLFMRELASLDQEIKNNAPGITSYLRAILNNLKKYEELTHLLNDEQIAIITSGLLKKTNTDMASLATKKKGGKKIPMTIDEATALF